MNSKANTQSGERLSFYKLFKQKKYRVLIPIIQRDYAQGRKTTKEVRDAFLKALYEYLDDNKPNRDLDFVYGSLSEVSGAIDFIPLDGQQRLTTLFLLHWYLYQISDNETQRNDFINVLFKDDKSMFTYETRSSSSEFCDALMSNNIDFNGLIELDEALEGNISHDSLLSETIKNSHWFYLSWQYDLTIKSMLTMLDAIHEKFAGKKEFFERLLDLENPIITFLFLNLKDFRLTDDLYIKMNSRGKLLTPFENFKAKFEQYLDDLKTDRKFKLNFKDNGEETEREVSFKKYFSYKIDTKWANLFWNYRTLQNRLKTGHNTFDDELMNFIRVIFTNKYASNTSVTSKEKDDRLEYLLGTNIAKKENKDYSDIISYHKYKELEVIFDKEEEVKYEKLIDKATDENEKEYLKAKKEKNNRLSKKCALFLTDAFDCLKNRNERIETNLSDNYKFYYNEQKAFGNALKHSFDSNHQRLCFHAYISYLIYNKNDLCGINQWMRVIHNLTHPDNTVIDNASEVAAAVKSIDRMIIHSKDILKFLTTNPKISFFSSWQVYEEKIKAHLILKDNKWKAEIEKYEKHRCFNGQIGFILDFAGIPEYYTNNENCIWHDTQNEEYFTKYLDFAEKASVIFEESYEKRNNNKDYCFERAVLTKGDFLTKASQYRKNLLSTNLVKNNIKRDHSWKRLLRLSFEKESINRRSLVKQVFDDTRFKTNQIEASLEDICKDRTNTWRDHLIDCPSLIKYCKQGFIRFEDEHNILLYGESQSNFYHAEIYTYYLWKKFIEPNKDLYKPFKKVDYNHVKSIDDEAYIDFKDFCYNKVNYQIKVYYCNNDKLANPFEIAFRIYSDENLPENFGDEIRQIINSLNFSWSGDYSGYFYTSTKMEDTLGKLTEMTQELNKLT